MRKIEFFAIENSITFETCRSKMVSAMTTEFIHYFSFEWKCALFLIIQIPTGEVSKCGTRYQYGCRDRKKTYEMANTCTRIKTAHSVCWARSHIFSASFHLWHYMRVGVAFNLNNCNPAGKNCVSNITGRKKKHLSLSLLSSRRMRVFSPVWLMRSSADKSERHISNPCRKNMFIMCYYY